QPKTVYSVNSGPYMQALHFTYGIGSFVAPLICEPFLSSESIHTGSHGIPHIDTTLSSTPSSIVPTTLLAEAFPSDLTNSSLFNLSDDASNTLPAIDPIDFLIYVPYAIAGSITVISSLVVLVM